MKQDGLTLIEVMIAMVILSLVMSAALVTSGHTLRVSERLHQKVLKSWTLEHIAVKLQSGQLGEISPHATWSGEQRMGHTTWLWEAQAEPVDGWVSINIKIDDQQKQMWVLPHET